MRKIFLTKQLPIGLIFLINVIPKYNALPKYIFFSFFSFLVFSCVFLCFLVCFFSVTGLVWCILILCFVLDSGLFFFFCSFPFFFCNFYFRRILLLLFSNNYPEYIFYCRNCFRVLPILANLTTTSRLICITLAIFNY